MPVVSIIVPIYNVEPYLPRCIGSILAQSFSDLELILVDDGSPDNCGKICDQYAALDSRVQVIHQSNAGVSTARNAGLNVAKGQYIGFVDPDDWIAPDMYAHMLEAMEKSNAQLAVCGYNYYAESGTVDEARLYEVRSNEIIDRQELMKRMSDMPPSLRHGVVNKLFRSEVLHGQTFPVGLHSSEDVHFLTQYLPKVKTAAVVHQPLYQNLVRQGSATHGGLNISSLADSFQAHQEMYDTIVKTYPALKNHTQAFYLDVCLLKYSEAKRKLPALSADECEEIAPRLRQMKHAIKTEAWNALWNREIFWKTRIMYLLFK